MMETLVSRLLPIGAVASIMLLVWYVYFQIRYSYWKKRGIPTFKPTAPFGNFSDSILSGKNPGFEIVKLYKAFEGHRLGGLYRLGAPSLLLRDPDAIRDILVKDFDHFFSRGRLFDEEAEPLDAHLFSLSGSKWRNLRVRMTPLFTTHKMKMMFGTVVECGKDLQNCLQKPANNGETIEIKDYLARYTTDVISSCAFGVQCNCLKNPDAEFRNWGRRIFEPNFRQRVTSMLQVVSPSLVYILKLSLFPKEVTNYFRKMVQETVQYREKNNVQRNDFMQLMIQLKNKTLLIEEDEDFLLKEVDQMKSTTPFEITMDVIAAQAFVFFVAGFETSSATMTFCLYEMAVNPDIQERVRSEINTVLDKHGGNITYESISDMEYLDKVVSGMRFGLMQTKVGLISFLSNYEVRVSDKTTIPPVLDSRSIILSSKGGMWLTIVNRRP